jgi:hypothetical protein
VFLVEIGHSVVQVCGSVVHAGSSEVHGFVAVVLLGPVTFHLRELTFLLRELPFPNRRPAEILRARPGPIMLVAHGCHIARSRTTLRARTRIVRGGFGEMTPYMRAARARASCSTAAR